MPSDEKLPVKLSLPLVPLRNVSLSRVPELRLDPGLPERHLLRAP